MIFTTTELLCPGMYLERSPLSVIHLSEGQATPHAYKPRDIVLAQLAGTTYLLADPVNTAEPLVDLITFGDSEATNSLFIVSKSVSEALHWDVPGFKRGPGRLHANWRSTVNKDLSRMGITCEEDVTEEEVTAQNISEWRQSVVQCIRLDGRGLNQGQVSKT